MSHRHRPAFNSHHKNSTGTKDADGGQRSDGNFQLRKDDDTNYDHVTMDMSEESNNNISDVESPRRRSSQSSADRDYYKGRDSSPDDKDTSKFKERCFVPSVKDDQKYSRDFDKKSSSDRSIDGDNKHGNDDNNGKYNSSKEKESSRRYEDGSSKRDREVVDRRDRDASDRRERDSDRDRRYDDRDRDRHSRDYKDKCDKKYHSERSSKLSNDEKRRDRSRSRDRSSKRRSHSGDRDRDRNRSHYRRSDGSRRSDSRERRSFKRSRSRDRSPISNSEYKPSYKVSKKLQALDKMGLQIKAPDGSMATPQMLLKQTLADQVEKVKNETGIELPKYYNPAIMNPLKYANQIQKRKLLWGNKSKEIQEPCSSETIPQNPLSSNRWQGTKFAQDTDGKVASKFMRLMGIKDPATTKTNSPDTGGGDIVKKQEEMFEAMQAQYDVARATTHTMRGVGLGFSSHNKHF